MRLQCLAPWLDGLTDPAKLKSDTAALGNTLSNDLAPALSAVAGDVNDLAVSYVTVVQGPARVTNTHCRR